MKTIKQIRSDCARHVIVPAIVVLLILTLHADLCGQSDTQFDISLRIDYSSVEELLDFFGRQTFNSERVARLRGNQLAAATSLYLARKQPSVGDVAHELELVRDRYNSGEDVYGLQYTQSHIDPLRKLLSETRKRQLDRRVVSTVESYFPSDTKLTGSIPVYVVAMGNERAAAFVRRVIWKDDRPEFVGEDEGEQVIVLNLARMMQFSPDVNAQFVQVLGTLAHESFHAAFGIYQGHSSTWQSYHRRPEPIWRLAEIVENEGIAYYLSLQIQIGGQSPSLPWFDATSRAIKSLNEASMELASPTLTSTRARELIMNSNLGGSFEGNYGATAGLRIAYEIDTRLGRPALVNTISGGIGEFVGTYEKLCRENSGLPKLDERVLSILKQ